MPRTRPGMLAWIRADGSAEEFPLQHEVTTIGRSEACTIALRLPTVSRLHTLISERYDRYVLADAGSANGTFVNGRLLDREHVLNSDDEIWLGSSEAALIFADPEETLRAGARRAAALQIDEGAREVWSYGLLLPLSRLEYDLLLHLARHPGTVCTRESCFVAVWRQPYDPAICEAALNACLAKLRRNLRDAAERAGQPAPRVTTILRVGFRLDAPVAFAPCEPPTNL